MNGPFLFVAWEAEASCPQIAEQRIVALVEDGDELRAMVIRAATAGMRWATGPVNGQGFSPEVFEDEAAA